MEKRNTQAEVQHREVYDLTKMDEPRFIEDLKPKSKNMGSSQANPINLECAQEDVLQEISSDSDDEPPETLPTNQASLKALPAPFSADPFRYYSAMVDAAITANNNVQKRIEKRASSEAMIPDSDIEASGVDFNYSTSEDELGSNSDIDCEGTDVHNWSDDFSEDEEDWDNNKADIGSKIPQALPVANAQDLPSNPTATKVNNLFQPPHVLVGDSQLLTPPQARVDITGALDVSKPVGIAATQWNEPLPRAPSPSDAALAKPPHARIASADKPEKNNFKRCAADVVMWQGSQHGDQGLQSDDTRAFNPISDSWVHPAQAISAPYNSLASDEYFENIDRCLPLYDDGPFTGWSYMATNQVGPNNTSNFSASGYKSQISVGFNGYPPTSDQYEMRMNNNRENVNSSGPWMAYPVPAAQPHSSSAPLVHSSDTSFGKSSKLPISDIVNKASSQADASAPTLKRKADEMSVVESDESQPRAQVNNIINDSQDSCFPDAQPREDIGPSNTTLHDTISQSIPVAPQLTSISSQPVRKGEPARKRIKTSSRSSKPVKAFVSGILVGCIGLAGACAAFIATIPDAVKAEALRDY